MQVLQELTVQDAYHLDLLPSLIVGPDEDFSNVVERFATMPEVRGIFVADEERRLLGVIARQDLLDWARLKVGDFLLHQPAGKEKALRIITLMHASTAGGVMHQGTERAGVKVTDSLAIALRKMMELDLVVLPVVDEKNRIVEDVKLDEILALIVEKEDKPAVTTSK